MSEERHQLSPREVAKLTGFSYHAILRAIKRGDLAACEPIPGRLRIETSEYERWRTRPAQHEKPRETQPRQQRQRRGDTAGSASFDHLTAIEGGKA
jgi:hypothetical protein